MKTKETSTREKALAWWNELSQEKQIDLQHIHRSPSRHPLNAIGLTGREIEEIWRKENPIAALPDEMINTDFDGIEEEHSLPSINESLTKLGIDYNQTAKATNSKVFKQFNESLFKAYIDKFSDEDKIKAFKTFKKQISDMLYKFADIVDDSYRPVTRDNMNGYMAIPEFKKQEGIE